MLPRLLSEVRRRRTARRRTTVLAAAAAVGEAAAEGRAELVEKGWGTELVLKASSLPTTGPFTLEVAAADGTTQRAATWGPTPAGKALVTGATSVPRSAR